jgi:hypothetical protein
MGDRPGNPFQLRTSEDKVRRKDLCGSEWARPRRGGTLQNGIKVDSRGFMGACVAVAHGWSGPRVVTQYGTCAGTGHTDVAKWGLSWLGIDREDVGLLRG